MNAVAIRSARQVAARVVGSQIVPAFPAALPALTLGLGGYTKETLPGGRVRVSDASGGACGIFTNEALADACISSLTRR